MKKLFKIYIPGLVLLGLLFLMLQPNPYFRRALFYNVADIDDYKLFHNRKVEAGKEKAWKLHSNYNQYKLNQEELNFLNQYQTTAFLVVKDTSVLFESYHHQFTDSTISNSFSMAKSIVSLLIGVAIAEEKINSVDDYVYQYIPEFKTGQLKEITLRHLLTMSSGLKWNESYYNPFSATTKAYYGNELNKLVLKAKVIDPPGIYFDYITANTQLLAIILERVTKKTLSKYASEKLWKPIGASNDALWSLDQKNGVEKAYCCFNANARDFARIGQLIANKGKWSDKQIIPENYLSKALMPAYYLMDEKNEPVDFYGFHWWLGQYKNFMFYYARGILGQYIITIPSENLVIVRLGHKRSRNKINHHPEEIFGYLDMALKIAH
ncbi:MAG: serine hydrolase domain-containing protein [Thiohalospira sp.]